MDWMNFIQVGGGFAGIVALVKVGIDVFNARSNRNTVDISNLEAMLKDSMERYKNLDTKFEKFQKDSHTYVEQLRGRIVKQEEKTNNLIDRVNILEKVINLAWRCKYPESIQDCPVIAEYEKRNCGECENEHCDKDRNK